MKHKIAAITGANGFIGGHLTKELQKQGFIIYPIKHTYLWNYEELVTKLRFENPQYIFALHAYGNMANQKDYREMVTANVIDTFNLLHASKNIHYKAFINVSSSSVMLTHQTIYSATKLAGEALCKAYVDEYNKPIVIVRPYSIYGEGEADFRFIPTVFRSCLTGEAMTLAPDSDHDWVYVGDFIREMITYAGQAKTIAGSSMNIATGIHTKNMEIISIIEAITGKPVNIEEMKQIRSFDTVEWTSTSTFENPVSIEEGLQRCYGYYKKRYTK